MTLFGIKLRKPSFNEVTAATVLAVGLWIAVLGFSRASGHPLDISEAGALLLLAVWGSLGARLGVRLDKGGRHLAVSLAVSALLLGVYQAAWALTV
jgi:hypothetical protein